MNARTFFLMIIGVLSLAVQAKNNHSISGFEDFFELKKIQIKLRNLDGTYSRPIVFLSNFEFFKLESNDSEVKVRRFLNVNGIDEKYSDTIINTLKKGVSNTKECKGYIKECVIIPEKFEFLYNFTDSEVYFFVNGEILDESKRELKNDYHSSLNTTPGIANSVNAYFSSYMDQGTSLSLDDTAILGMKYGYFSSKLNLALSSDNDSELTAYDLTYNLDWKDKLIKAGYYQYSPSVNSTDFLSGSNSLSPQVAAVLGSSSKMLVEGERSQKKLTFSSPQEGDVEVRRDGRIIYQRPINEGRNDINYSELPNGRYQVELTLRIRGEEFIIGNYFIYNESTNLLAEGDFDYMVALGQLSSGNGTVRIEDIEGKELESKLFAQSRLSYQLFPSLALGIGLIKTKDDFAIESGVKYSMLELDSDVLLNGKVFKDGSYLNASLTSKFGSFNYEKLNNNESYLASYFHDNSSFERGYWSSNYNLSTNASLYATYSFYRKTDPIYVFGERTYEEQNFNYDDLTIGLRIDSFRNSTLDLSYKADLDFNESFLYVTFTLPLSESIDFISSFSGNEESIYQVTNSLRKDQLFDSDEISNSLYVASTYDRENKSLIHNSTISASYNNELSRGNGSIYISSEGNAGVSGSLSSSQLISDNNYYSSKAATSYVILDIENRMDDHTSQSDRGYLTVKRNGKPVIRKLVEKEKSIIPLSEYEQYDIYFDSDSVDLYNSGDSVVKVFSVPGTVETIIPKIHEKISFLTKLHDINERTVQDLRCEGDACISIDEISNGIYRITVLAGVDFELHSSVGRCFIPSQREMIFYNLGKNYCLPTDESNMNEILVDGRGYIANYVGIYHTSDIESSEHVKRLKEIGYRLIVKNVGDVSVVYIAQNEARMNKLFDSFYHEVMEIKSMAITETTINMSLPVAVNYQ